MDLSGHLALITGAGQGIGRACAEVFALKGADLILLDKNPETLAATADKITATGWIHPVTRRTAVADVGAEHELIFGIGGFFGLIKFTQSVYPAVMDRSDTLKRLTCFERGRNGSPGEQVEECLLACLCKTQYGYFHNFSS